MFTARYRLEMPRLPAFSNPALQTRLQQHLDCKTKPQGSLGQLEALAVQLGLILDTTSPEIRQPQALVFAADHGLAAEGISAYPQEVTQQMVMNFLNGGAAINVFARQHDIALQVIDAGVQGDLPSHPRLVARKIMPGTRNSLHTQAMNAEECLQAVISGMALVRETPGNLLILGEMGIGNTSAASLLLSHLGKLPLEDCLGSGTGLDAAGLKHKQQILLQVARKHRLAKHPLEVLAAMGGLEIAMMTGALLQGASERRILLMDGFIACSALLVAECLQPGIKQFAVFSHQSAEPGHALLLKQLDATPLLNLQLRLGEGTGAALAYPLLESALAFYHQMASFEAAGISEKKP